MPVPETAVVVFVPALKPAGMTQLVELQESWTPASEVCVAV